MNLTTETFEQYCARPGVRSSDVKRALIDPEDYRMSKLPDFPEKPQSKAMALGEYIHALMYEPYRVGTFAIKPEGMSFATKEGKEWKAKAEESGCQILTEEDARASTELVWRVRNHKMLKHFLPPSADCEKTLVGEIGGFECKIRIDSLKNGIICDAKKSKAMNPSEFLADAWSYDYDLQAEFYRQVFESVSGKRPKFIWKVLAPGPMQVWAIDIDDYPDFVESGKIKVLKGLENIGLVQSESYRPQTASVSLKKFTRWDLEDFLDLNRSEDQD